MQKRKYSHVQNILPQVQQMISEGMCYREIADTFEEANEMIDRYIHFYNHERIQLKSGVTPLMLRHSA